MSCDGNRGRFFAHIANDAVSAADLERAYQANRRTPHGGLANVLSIQAKTRLLFGMMKAAGLKPPTHSANGMPKVESQTGYAAVYDLLKKNGLAQAAPCETSAAVYEANDPLLDAEGRDAEGRDRWGYDREGYDRDGFDREGYNREGWSRVTGRNRQGYNQEGEGEDGFKPDGYKSGGFGEDMDGYDRWGYKNRLDPHGYDLNGYDAEGYDREGYNHAGLDRNGNPDPNFAPDANGIYPDGFDKCGYGLDGYDRDGYDRYGFGRDGYNIVGCDRNGNDRQGKSSSFAVDADGYHREGYNLRSRLDRCGYDEVGFTRDPKTGRYRSFTGYDHDGRDASGKPRQKLGARGKPVNVKFNGSGYDEDGYDRWGYHHETGLTAPDEQGRRRNTFGWVYDEASDPDAIAKDLYRQRDEGRLGDAELHRALDGLPAQGECYDPNDPARRVRHQFKRIRFKKSKREKIVCNPYIPPAPPPPITPFAEMTEEQYLGAHDRDRYSGAGIRGGFVWYENRKNPPLTVGHRRGALDDKVRNGVRLRCPHCGQYSGGDSHACPNFGGREIRPLRSGVVLDGRSFFTLSTPHNPNFDPEFDNTGGYSVTSGLDRDGYDKNGYNARGFNREGYNRQGYDLFGYDRDGYDRDGYNNHGVNRKGERRGSSLRDMDRLLDAEGNDLLANEDLARMYSQIATGLVGRPRRVILQEGGGFSTDMRGTIQAEPYPLGRDADPRHNLIVTRAGIYHEIGHEQFTSQEVWAKVLDVAQGKQEAGLGEAARRMLPRFFNIVEDGRMEREVSRSYKGAAEILAASCRLEPRWDEAVGEGEEDGQQAFWALLYTALPYYRVRSEVRNGMTPRARKVFEELEPHVIRATRGSTEDAYQAAAHITRRFEEEGFIQLPPKDSSQMMPPPPRSSGQQGQGSSSGGQGEQQEQGQRQGSSSGGQGQQQGQGSSSSGQGQQQGQESDSGNGRGTSKQDEGKQGKGRGAGGGKREEEKKGRRKGRKEENASAQGQGSSADGQDAQSGQPGSGVSDGGSASQSDGAGDDKSNDFLFGSEVVDAAARAMERDAAFAIENGVRARSLPKNIGKPLHKPLPNESSMTQRYRNTEGMPQSVDVYLPKGKHNERLQERRARHHEIASQMTKPLKAIREQAEQRLRRQNEGRLDRRQLVNAYKGMEDVRANVKELPQTSFAASIAVDMSGSMHRQVRNMELYDAVMTLGDCLDTLDVPFEVRPFGSTDAQVKAMKERFDPDRAAFLAQGGLGGTVLADTAGLAHSSLQAAEEKNKLMVCLSDGELGDHEKTARVLREARQNRMVTFGIFLGEGADEAKMNELYGLGNWTTIQTLSDMPKAVAQRLSILFRSMR